jgi:hypothetical protein
MIPCVRHGLRSTAGNTRRPLVELIAHRNQWVGFRVSPGRAIPFFDMFVLLFRRRNGIGRPNAVWQAVRISCAKPNFHRLPPLASSWRS